MSACRKVVLGRLVLLGLMVCASGAAAQYKWVGPDGRVTYSDRPAPPDAKPAVVRDLPPPTPAAAASDAALPYELRQISQRYPVKLYTTKDCGPCQQARSLLIHRGVPFAESTIATRADVDAFKKLGFDSQMLPVLVVGREKVAGFESGRYDGLLDAAGYPKSSTLPRSYAWAPAQPLTPPADAANEAPASPAATPGREALARARTDVPSAATPSVPAPVGAANPNFRF